MIRRFPAVRRWDDTDDVFQNAALRLHRALGQVPIDSTRSLMALAATQLHRELIDLARRHAGPQSQAANHASDALPLGAAGGSGMQHVDRVADADAALDRWSRFHEAIAGLPDDQREIFHLVWYVGADQRTIAAILGCSPRTVKYRWREAREAVRAALGDEPPQ
jgi:RNA polymerase sigma-70 factor (ECF subfamily)